MYGTFTFTMPWASMVFDITKKDDGTVGVVVRAPEREQVIIPDGVCCDGDTIQLKIGSMGLEMMVKALHIAVEAIAEEEKQ